MRSRPTNALARQGMALVEAFAVEHGTTVARLRGRRRHRVDTTLRQHLYADLYAAGLTVTEVAWLLDRDHSTVCHGIAAHEARALELEAVAA